MRTGEAGNALRAAPPPFFIRGPQRKEGPQLSNSFTLDDLRAEVEREYAPLEITLSDGSTVTLKHLLRLPKKTRDKVVDTLKALETKEGDDPDVDVMVDAATQVLKLVADNGTGLVKELDGDVTLVMRVLERWMQMSQPGEAAPSPA
jgi:hypothetical protein